MVHERKWIAYISVACSGPAFSLIPSFMRASRPRLFADLRCTTADVEYLVKHWKTYHQSKSLNLRLRNPSREGLREALAKAGDWLAGCVRHRDWDGGGICFAYAGHGHDGNGALVLEDGDVTAVEFL